MPSRASTRHASSKQSCTALPPCPIICIGLRFTSELLYPWVTSGGKSVEAASSPGRGWVCSRPCTTLIICSRKVGSDSFFGESVPAISYSMRFGLASRPPSSVNRSTSKRSNSVTRFSVHYTVDLGSTNLSIPNLSMYPRPSSSSRPPSRPRYRPLSALHHPTRTRTLYSKVCIFHHVICSSANLLSVIVTPSHWLHVKPLSRYVARDQSDTHLPEINKLHKNYSLLLVFAEPSTNLFDLFSSIRLMI